MSLGVWVSDDMRLKEFILVLHAVTKEEWLSEQEIKQIYSRHKAMVYLTNLTKFIAPHTSIINRMEVSSFQLKPKLKS